MNEVEMRVIVPTLVGLAALSAVSAQAAPNPSNWHETPAQNVWRSQQYDYLLRTNTSMYLFGGSQLSPSY
jgi:hypothetical protein